MLKGRAIQLRPTGWAIVDEDVYLHIERYKWSIKERTVNRPRALTCAKDREGKLMEQFLEKVIAKAPGRRYVRFRNSNTLDCRRISSTIPSTRLPGMFRSVINRSNSKE